MKWEIPRNLDEVISFIGFESYYRRFNRNFSWISHSITSLQRKGKKFEWVEECAANFEQLKKLLTNAPVLKISNPDKEFVVCKNSYNRGLGGVMTEEGQVVCYESRKLNDQEHNYVTHDLEMAVIIHALKMWRHYLLGKRFVMMIDHNGLRYLFEQLNLNSRQAR